MWGSFWGGGAVSSSLLLLCAGEAIVVPLAGVCLCASSCGACGFPWRVLPQVTLRELCNLSGSSCLSCSCGGAMFEGFSLLCQLFLRVLRLALRPLPQVALGGFCPFSDTVCLTYCCAGGVSWSATLLFCYRCLSCTGWLAGVRWVLHLP